MEDDRVVLVPADGAGAQLSLGLSETPVQEHPRIHLDLNAGYAAIRPTRPGGWCPWVPSAPIGIFIPVTLTLSSSPAAARPLWRDRDGDGSGPAAASPLPRPVTRSVSPSLRIVPAPAGELPFHR